MPSDVTPESFNREAGSVAVAAEPDMSLANDLLQIISSGVGEGYIPYSEADKRFEPCGVWDVGYRPRRQAKQMVSRWLSSARRREMKSDRFVGDQ